MAEAYVAHECVTYCKAYLPDAEPETEEQVPPMDVVEYDISCWLKEIKPGRRAQKERSKLTRAEVKEAHWSVLSYTDDHEPLEYFKSRHLGHEQGG